MDTDKKIIIVGAGPAGLKAMAQTDHGITTVVSNEDEKITGELIELFSMKNKEVQQRIAFIEEDYLVAPKSGQEKRRERRKNKKR